MQYVIAFFVLVISANANSGQYADFVGVYLADENGDCKSTFFLGEEVPDSNMNGACFPITTTFDKKKNDLLLIAIIELTDPENLDYHLQREVLKRQPTEAFEVEVDTHKDDIFRLSDGSILEKTSSGYIGYIGYHEDAVLYKDDAQWKLCVNDNSHEVDVLKYVESHYSKSYIRGKSVREIEAMEPCK